MTEGLGDGGGCGGQGTLSRVSRVRSEVRSQSPGFSEATVRSTTGLSQRGILISRGPYKPPPTNVDRTRDKEGSSDQWIPSLLRQLRRAMRLSPVPWSL